MDQRDDYIRRTDPEHVSLVRDVGDMKHAVNELTKETAETKKSLYRTERYLVGGWSDDGDTWIVGIRERIMWALKWFWAIATGVWAIVIIIIAAVANWYFGFIHPPH